MSGNDAEICQSLLTPQLFLTASPSFGNELVFLQHGALARSSVIHVNLSSHASPLERALKVYGY